MFWGPNEDGGRGYPEELAAFIAERSADQPAVLWPRSDLPPDHENLGQLLAGRLTQYLVSEVSPVLVVPTDGATDPLHPQVDLLVIQTAGSSTVMVGHPGGTEQRPMATRAWGIRLRRGEVLFLPREWIGTLHPEDGTRYVLLQIAARPGAKPDR